MYMNVLVQYSTLLKMKFEGYTMKYDGYPYLVGIKKTWYEGYTIWYEGYTIWYEGYTIWYEV